MNPTVVKTTVLIVMPLAEQRGGAETLLLHLLRESVECPGDVRYIVVYQNDGPMVAQTRAMGIPVYVVHSGRIRDVHRWAVFGWKVAHIARREQADVVLGWLSNLYSGVAARLAGLPAIWFQQGRPSPNSFLDKLSARLPARGILVNSRSIGISQAQVLPARPQRLVFPAVSLEKFDARRLPPVGETRRRLQLPEATDVSIVGIVARLQRWKGVHTLIAAIPQIRAAVPNAYFVVVGGRHELEPEYEGVVQKQVADQNLHDVVRFAGLQEDVPLWMHAMDVIVHASRDEPFGMVVVEAMALGKPVVAGDSGGPAEIITEGENGLFAAYDDADTLARQVIRYLREPEFAGKMGRAARVRAQDFSKPRFAREMSAAIAALLSPRSSEKGRVIL